MVDFRYHLVSIIAVFLALAVGIVVGTAALNGPVLDDLRDNISRLSSDKRALESDVATLRGDVTASDQFALSIAGDLVRGSLDGEQVLLVVTPDAPGDIVEQLTPLLKDAGATVAGELRVLPTLSDPEQRLLVEDVVAAVVPAGVSLPDTEPVDRAAVELAAALTRQPGEDGIELSEAQAVVSAFEEADLVQYAADGPLELATAVIVVGGPAPEPDQEPDQVRDGALQAQVDAMLRLARAFDDGSGGVVVTGPTGVAGENGLVSALRGDSGLSGRVSSVDNADRGVGAVAVVQALAEQVRGTSGQYGAGAGASGPGPSIPSS